MDKECFYKMCYYGIISQVLVFIEKYRDENVLNECLYWACRGKEKEVIDIIIKNFITTRSLNWDRAFEGACKGGSMDIIKFTGEKRTNNAINWSCVLDNACQSNSIEAVKYVISKIPINYQFFGDNNFSFFSTNIEVIKLMISKGLIRWNESFRKACYNGCFEIANLLILEKSSIMESCIIYDTEFTNCELRIVCERNHYNIAKLLLSKGANIDFIYNYYDDFIYNYYDAKIIELLMQNNILFDDRVMEKYKEYVRSKITTSVFLKKKLIPFHIVNRIINEYF